MSPKNADTLLTTESSQQLQHDPFQGLDRHRTPEGLPKLASVTQLFVYHVAERFA